MRHAPPVLDAPPDLSIALLLGLCAMETPATAAPATILFTLSTANDSTTIIPCPPGTPSNLVLCGYARDSVITATTTAGDAGLSGTVTDSYVSVLEAPALTPECAAAMTPHSAGKLRRPSAPFFWVTAGGGFCTITGQGIEPLTIVGRTGAYEGAGA